MHRSIASAVLLVFVISATARGQAYPTEYGLPSAWDSFARTGIVNMKDDAGAVGDGKTDDTAAFQAVFGAGKYDKHPEFGAARRIYIPPGTYLIRDTIRWGDKKKFVRGAGTGRTVLRLADGTFTDPENPRHVLDVKGEQFMAQNFGQRLMDLTVEVGAGNPGAIGIGYHTNNSGALANVVIRSSDPDGVGFAGLDLYGNTGPGLCWNLQIEGFEYGIHSQSKLHSMTLARLTLRGQRRAAILNDRQSLFLSHVESHNEVPFLKQGTVHGGGFVTLVQASLASEQSEATALEVEAGALMVRDVTTPGYAEALRYHGEAIPESALQCWGRPQPPGIDQQPVPNLPTRLPPPANYGDPEEWSVIEPGQGAAALRAAIESGARVVFVPPKSGFRLNDTVELPASLEILHGFGTICRTDDGFVGDEPMRDPLWEGKHGGPQRNNRLKPVYRVVGDSGRPLRVQFLFDSYGESGWGVDHACRRDLVLWACHSTYKNSVRGGTVFLLDAGGAPYHLVGNTAYVWHLNSESYNWNPHVMNEGGRLWICGHKTEKDRTNLATTAGGWTELNGAWYMKNRERVGEAPMIVVSDSTFSGAFANTYLPYEVLLRERQGTETKTIDVDSAGRVVGLYQTKGER
jgi:hypothetical protein